MMFQIKGREGRALLLALLACAISVYGSYFLARAVDWRTAEDPNGLECILWAPPGYSLETQDEETTYHYEPRPDPEIR